MRLGTSEVPGCDVAVDLWQLPRVVCDVYYYIC